MDFSFDWDTPEDVKDMSTEQILNEFQFAIENLPGSGAKGRSRFYTAREELKRRLNQKIILSNIGK